MAESETPVKRLTFVNLRFEEPVSVDLPDWGGLPSPFRKGLDDLDTNDDGQIVIDTRVTAQKGYTYSYFTAGGDQKTLKVEVGNLNGSWETSFRYFWAFRGDNPFNNSSKDRATWEGRVEAVHQVQEGVAQKVIPQIVADRKDLLAWEEVGLAFSALADAEHLYRTATGDLYPLWKKTRNREFLLLADRFLMEAKRFAGATREGRKSWLGKIEAASRKVGEELDRLERSDFLEEKRGPYLLSRRGAPWTLEEGGGGLIVFRVSITEKERATELVQYYREHPVFIRPSRFKGEISKQPPIPLEPVSLVKEGEEPLSNKDYFDQDQVSPVAFEEKGRRTVLLAFKLPEGVNVEELREGLGIRGYDLLLYDRPGGEVRRVVPGAIVFQKTAGRDVRIAYASDLHIAERDYLNRKRFLGELLRGLGKMEKGEMDMTRFLAPENHALRRIERFYESINESVEAMVAVWNERYRRGELDKVVLAGDIADFINAVPRMEKLGFRMTNLHRVTHILSKLEAPLYLIWGNHDPHIVEYALSFRREYFPHERGLYEGIHLLDRANLGKEDKISLAGLSIKGLFDSYYDDDGPSLDGFLEAARRTMQANVYQPRREGMQPHFLRYQASSAFVTPLTVGRDQILLDTLIENFALKKYNKEDVPAPALLNAFQGAASYIGKMAANGLGPTEEAFGFLIRTVAKEKEKKKRLQMVTHYPIFNGGVGPTGHLSTVDTMEGKVAWAFRILCWLYRYDREKDGKEGPVIDLVLSGHLHRTGAYTFHLAFDSPEEEGAFRRKAEALFTEAVADPEGFYDQVEELVIKFNLDDKIELPAAKDPSKNDALGVAMAQLGNYNRDSRSYVAKHGTLFMNLPAAGPPSSEAPPGFVEMTIHPDDKIELHPFFVYLPPDGRILAGGNASKLEKERTRLDNTWRRSIGLPVVEPESPEFEAIQRDFPVRGDPIEMIVPDYEKPDKKRGKEQRWDFPIYTNKVGWWSLQGGWWPSLRVPDINTLSLWSAKLSVPMSKKYRPLGLNALTGGALLMDGKLLAEVGADLGLLHPSIVTDFTHSVGAALSFQSPLPFLHLMKGWVVYDPKTGEIRFMAGPGFELTIFSVKPD